MNPRFDRQQHANHGLTLVECLIAILVVNLGVAMLAAPLLMVAATRLRNDRINQATELARAEVDRLRVMMEQGVEIRSTTTSLLPPQSSVSATIGQANQLSAQSPPSSLEDCSGALGLPTSATRACRRRLNNTEFAVQVYRGQLTVNSSNLVLAYPVQVRVYSAEVVPVTTATVPVAQEPAAMTSSLVGAETRPLAVLTTEIIRSDSSEALCRLTNCS
ncbi:MULTISPECIES: type IV pilus modification PilV family protein [unclassified Thermosynechococcus]|uniref:type IV pilus modification PilV family protein n=1 Tax=unclassified Thermosynechococcus TaxID=2622553 RepID=UPI0019DDDCFC|nr:MULTISPECIES: hypothetical protein [unclassified Thermosynechococcus]HIK36035.1 hypothetical protein [Thermosynechococcus sp. M98_K2018_005]HIK49036.1 hypothetical protein [Thermosynechococcus sp. M55_K2018_012]